jgi:hypothetical protein
MKNSIKIAILFSIVFTTISNAQSKWGKEVWDAYMNSCVEASKETFGLEKATTYCGCTGVKLEIRYPDANQLSVLGETEIMEIANICLEEDDNAKSNNTNSITKSEGPKPPTPPGKSQFSKPNYTGATNWSKTGYDSFMETCVESAKESLGGEDAAKKYCDCSASKLQLKYPDETKVTVTEAEINKIAEECLSEK